MSSLVNQHLRAGEAAYNKMMDQVFGGHDQPFITKWDDNPEFIQKRWIEVGKAAVAAYTRAGGE